MIERPWRIKWRDVRRLKVGFCEQLAVAVLKFETEPGAASYVRFFYRLAYSDPDEWRTYHVYSDEFVLHLAFIGYLVRKKSSGFSADLGRLIASLEAGPGAVDLLGSLAK